VRRRIARVGESSASIRARVQSARDIQNKRFSNNGATDIFCGLQAEGQSLMHSAMTQLNLSARLCTARCHCILKLARTIAD
jgi:magnesium chelatase family protein